MGHRFTNDPAEVSSRMRLIRSRGTKPELVLFSILSTGHFKYKPHFLVAGVRVDAVIGKSLLVFVDSPFWHLRDMCELNRLSPYWRRRLLQNRRRDRRQERKLRALGFSILRFWTDDMEPDRVLRRVRVAYAKVKARRSKKQ